MLRDLQPPESPKRSWSRRIRLFWNKFRCSWGHDGDEIVCYHKGLVLCKKCGQEVPTSEVSGGGIDTLWMYCILRSKNLDGTEKSGDLGCTSLNCPRKK
jgi:hypothetical protein